jgi:PHD/YefM family antitoxin component YafN of YafNO toxin-antitoxin module
MNTKFIGIKDFRQNIAEYAKKAQSRKTRFVVMNRNRPLFEISPFAEEESLDSLYETVTKARAEAATGKVYSHKEVGERLGL